MLRAAFGVLPKKRSRETTLALLKAGAEMLRRRSLAELSIEALCAEVGATVGAFYSRFESKDAYFNAGGETSIDGVPQGNAAATLSGKAFQRDRSPGIPRPIAKGRNPATAFVHQILQIIQRPAPGLEPLKENATRGLALVGMAEHDVAVGEGRAVLGQFLQAEDDGVCRV